MWGFRIDAEFVLAEKLTKIVVLATTISERREYLIIHFSCFFTFVAGIRPFDELSGIVDLLSSDPV
jgi:hypothetical protein